MSLPRTLCVALLVAIGVPALTGAQDQVLTALDYRTTVPPGWQARSPSSSMRLAEYVIAGEAGAGAEVVLYFFGVGQGGSVDANIARWRQQFSNPDGGAVSESITRDERSAFPMTVAEWSGTYARGIGAEGAARPGQTLVAAIVETPKGTLFFQLFGPSAAVAGAKGSYLEMARGLK